MDTFGTSLVTLKDEEYSNLNQLHPSILFPEEQHQITIVCSILRHD